MGYVYIGLTIIFTVYGQLIMKWRMNHFGSMPEEFGSKIAFFVNVLIDPYIISGFIAAFLASLAWIASMTKFELSFAYPFMSLNFVLVLILSINIFGETLNPQKMIGLIIIILGTYISSRP